MLKAVDELAPDIYPFVHSVYSIPSELSWEDRLLQSAEGVQQGDPLGPLLFCLTLHHHCDQLASELCVMYLDDVGGTTEDILSDLRCILSLEAIGLCLNNGKSEIISHDPVSRGTILCSLPGARVVDPSSASLLGVPLGSLDSISKVIMDKVNSLKIMGERLHHISAHDALILLRNSFAIPKLLYTLRTAPCFHSPALKAYDEELKSIVSNITNIHFSNDDPAWFQATLPVRMGGLGIRRAVQLAPSAYLASAAATCDLMQDILPGHLRSLPSPSVDQALWCWQVGHHTNPPDSDGAKFQQSWDFPRAVACADSLLDNATDDRTRARLLAVSAPESGAWLHALPISLPTLWD